MIQIRSHAQKYFLKVQKNNTGEEIPPPRPKRKSRVSSGGGGGGGVRSRSTPQTPKKGFVGGVRSATSSPVVGWERRKGGRGGKREGGWGGECREIKMRKIEVGSSGCGGFGGGLRGGEVMGGNGVTNADFKRPNFAQIYRFFARLFDPQIPYSAEDALQAGNLTTLDKEIIKLLTTHLQANTEDAAFRNRLLAMYRQQINLRFPVSSQM